MPPGNTTLQQGAIADLQTSMSTFAANLNPESKDSASTLVKAQLGALAAIKAMLGTVTSGVQGFVPGYSCASQREPSLRRGSRRLTRAPAALRARSFEFYTTQLGGYFSTLESLSAELEDTIENEPLLKTFQASLSIEAQKNSASSQVVEEIESATITNIGTALDGMSAALDGLEEMSKEIENAGYDLEEAVQDWIEEQRTKAILGLVKMTVMLVAGVATGGMSVAASFVAVPSIVAPAAAGAAPTIGTATPGLKLNNLGGVNLGNTVKLFSDGVCNVGVASKKIKLMGDELEDLEATDFMLKNDEVIGKMVTQGVNLDYTEFSDDQVTSLTETIEELNEKLPAMGTGFWEKYYADGAEAIEPYLSGYNGAVNAAAQHYLDLLKVQSYCEWRAAPACAPSRAHTLSCSCHRAPGHTTAQSSRPRISFHAVGRWQRLRDGRDAIRLRAAVAPHSQRAKEREGGGGGRHQRRVRCARRVRVVQHDAA